MSMILETRTVNAESTENIANRINVFLTAKNQCIKFLHNENDNSEDCM